MKGKEKERKRETINRDNSERKGERENGTRRDN